MQSASASSPSAHHHLLQHPPVHKLDTAALRSLVRGVVGAEATEVEQKQLQALRRGLTNAVSGLVESLRRMRADAPADQLIERTVSTLYDTIEVELRAAGDANLRMRRAENEKEFMAQQITRREELAAAQRADLLRQLSVMNERYFHSRDQHQRTLTALRDLQHKVRTVSAGSPEQLNASRLGSFINQASTGAFGDASPMANIAAAQSITFSSFDLANTATSVQMPSASEGAGGSPTGGEPEGHSLTQAAADVRILSTRLDAEWRKLAEGEAVGLREQELLQEADRKLKEQAAKHKHEQSLVLQRQAKQMEQTLRSESLKLSARVRQLEHHLRKKEDEVEATLAKERQKWAGAASKSEAASTSMLQLERRNAMRREESLVMQIHDERAQHTVAVENLERQLRGAAAVVARLKEDVHTASKARERANQMIAAGAASPTSAAKAAAMENARTRHLQEQLRQTEERLAQSQRDADDMRATRASSGAMTPSGSVLQTTPGLGGTPGGGGRELPPPLDTSAMMSPMAASRSTPPIMFEPVPGTAAASAANNSSFANTLPPQSGRPASAGGDAHHQHHSHQPDSVAALEARVADLTAARETADEDHREALAVAVSETEHLKAELKAAQERAAGLEATVAELRLEMANHHAGQLHLAPRTAHTAAKARSHSRDGDRRRSAGPSPTGRGDGGIDADEDRLLSGRSFAAGRGGTSPHDHALHHHGSHHRSGGGSDDVTPRVVTPTENERTLLDLCTQLVDRAEAAEPSAAGGDGAAAAAGNAPDAGSHHIPTNTAAGSRRRSSSKREPSSSSSGTVREIEQRVADECSRLLLQHPLLLAAATQQPSASSASSSATTAAAAGKDSRHQQAEKIHQTVLAIARDVAASAVALLTMPHHAGDSAGQVGASSSSTGVAGMSAGGRPTSARATRDAGAAVEQPQQSTVVSRTEELLARRAARREALEAEERDRYSRVCQLSSATSGGNNHNSSDQQQQSSAAAQTDPASPDAAHAVLDETRGLREDAAVPSHGPVWVEMADVVARAQRVLAEGPLAGLRRMPASEQYTSAARASLHHVTHDVRFTVRTQGTQTDDVSLIELPQGFGFTLDCYQAPRGGFSESSAAAAGGDGAAASDTEYLLFLCNPLRQQLSATVAGLVAPPFVYDASTYFVPSDAEHIQRLSNFADKAMAGIAAMLNRPGNSIPPEMVDINRRFRLDVGGGGGGASSARRSSPPSSAGRRPQGRRASPERPASSSSAAAAAAAAGGGGGAFSDSVTRQTLKMVYHHRDRRQSLTPRPPIATPDDGDERDDAEGWLGASKTTLARAVASTLAGEATTRAVMTSSSSSRPTSARGTSSSNGVGAPPTPPGRRRDGARRTHRDGRTGAAAPSPVIADQRSPTPRGRSPREAAHQPMLMTKRPATLADRNNPYSTLRSVRSGRTLAPS